MRLITSSLLRRASGKCLSALTPRIKRLFPKKNLDGCRESVEAYDERHSVRTVSVYVGVYFVAVVLGWAAMAVVVAAWFRP